MAELFIELGVGSVQRAPNALRATGKAFHSKALPQPSAHDLRLSPCVHCTIIIIRLFFKETPPNNTEHLQANNVFWRFASGRRAVTFLSMQHVRAVHSVYSIVAAFSSSAHALLIFSPFSWAQTYLCVI